MNWLSQAHWQPSFLHTYRVHFDMRKRDTGLRIEAKHCETRTRTLNHYARLPPGKRVLSTKSLLIIFYSPRETLHTGYAQVTSGLIVWKLKISWNLLETCLISWGNYRTQPLRWRASGWKDHLLLQLPCEIPPPHTYTDRQTDKEVQANTDRQLLNRGHFYQN